ncbi:MAG: hypothetical protein CMJ18_21865 [Phycisphaeraceae bacterium]|nr:hypothetical protein [Phycisphaeraceae bacterium]
MNHVRAPLECLCWITESEGDEPIRYALATACKAERVNVDEDIWLEPNADFHPVGADNGLFLRIKSWDRADKGVMYYPPSRGVQPERNVGVADEAFDFQRIEVRTRQARLLEDVDQVIAAILEGRPLVARSAFSPDGVRCVLLEYPVKTINTSDRDGYYQVDTGPVLFPDLSLSHEHMIGNLRLAYVAHNAPDWAEFLLNVPVPVTDDVRVNHFAKAQRVDAVNTLFEVE